MTSLHASIALEKSRVGRAGADRIALLRAIGEHGSISAAARDVGLSYKAAWDAVQVLNNLFDRPLVLASAGGAAGGTTRVTDAGRSVIAAVAAAEHELAGVVGRLEAAIGGGGALQPLLWGIAMKTSARNALRGTVTRVACGAIDAEVELDVGDGVTIVASITRASYDDLGVTVGTPAIALIKSSLVILATGDGLRTSARNALAGTVARRDDGDIGSEVTLALTAGKTLTATLTRASADRLDLHIGSPAVALIKASHVILATG